MRYLVLDEACWTMLSFFFSGSSGLNAYSNSTTLNTRTHSREDEFSSTNQSYLNSTLSFVSTVRVHGHRHLPERSFSVERVSYGQLDLFQLVAWGLALDSVLIGRRGSRNTLYSQCVMCVRHRKLASYQQISK